MQQGLAGPKTSSQTTTSSGRDIVDRITYLASLVSAPTAVDEMLDTLRRITALAGPDNTIDQRYVDELLLLEARLKDYLINKDPVRSYTKESLERELQNQTTVNTTRQGKTNALIALSATALYAIAVTLVPRQTSLPGRFLLAAPILVAYLNGTIAWLFWSARKNFTAEIRKAYSYFCVGTFISAFASMQFPLLFALPALSEIPLFKYVGFMTPFVFACFAFYFGLRLYARQLEIKNILTSIWAMLLVAAILGVGAALAPHSTTVPEEAFFDLSVASVVMSGFFSFIAFLLAEFINSRVTKRYSLGMRLLGLSQLMQAIACAILTTLVFVSGPTSSITVGVGTVPFMIPAVLLLFSAYSFKKYAAGIVAN